MTVDRHYVPALGGEVQLGIFALRHFCHCIERHVVGIINEDQVVQSTVTREGDCLFGDPFLETAIAVDRNDVLIKNRVLGRVEARRSPLGGKRVTHRIADALSQRTRRRLHPRSFMKLRMARRDRVQAAEVFHILARNRVTGEM